MRILVIEDEETLARLIESRLKRENHDVDVALDGDTGLMEALRGIYDLIILDVMLPGTSGFDILSALKKQRISSKVIMLTARGALEDRLHGLKAGADDYVTKPFHLEELAARVSVQLRREEEGRRTAGDLELADQSNLLVCRTTGKSIELSAKELAVMDYLLSHPQQILSRDQILDPGLGTGFRCNGQQSGGIPFLPAAETPCHRICGGHQGCPGTGVPAGDRKCVN